MDSIRLQREKLKAAVDVVASVTDNAVEVTLLREKVDELEAKL